MGREAEGMSFGFTEEETQAWESWAHPASPCWSPACRCQSPAGLKGRGLGCPALPGERDYSLRVLSGRTWRLPASSPVSKP